VLPAYDFAYGLLNPGLALIVSCGGVFLGLRCTARARAREGAARARWLVLGGAGLGIVGIWAMHLIALLGLTVPGETIYYNVPVVIGSLLAAVAVACAGLLIVGFSPMRYRWLLLGGLITGLGVAVAGYLDFAAMRMPGRVSYQLDLVIISAAAAVVAATAVLWAAARLRGVRASVIASLITGAAVLGVHYAGTAALRVHRPGEPVVMVTAFSRSITAGSFLLPLVLVIGIVSFLVSAVLAVSPTEDETRYDTALLNHISERTWSTAIPAAGTAVVLRPSRNGRASRRASRGGRADGRASRNGHADPQASRSGRADPQASRSGRASEQASGNGHAIRQARGDDPAAGSAPDWTFVDLPVRRPPGPR
jgi:NO-binding membrane sensor protein with MHYT domain